MNQAIADELRALRARKDKTIKEVTANIDLDPGTLSRYENGKGKMSIEVIEKLLDYYEEDVAIFFANVSAKMHK